MTETELCKIWDSMDNNQSVEGWGGTVGSGNAPGDLDTLIHGDRLWARHNNVGTGSPPGPWTEIPGMARG